jgi:hypothetical protein
VWAVVYFECGLALMDFTAELLKVCVNKQAGFDCSTGRVLCLLSSCIVQVVLGALVATQAGIEPRQPEL